MTTRSTRPQEPDALAELTQATRHMWALGDFPAVAERELAPLGDRVGIRPGEEVLDVGCAAGNAAIRAARAVGQVTGLDLTPEPFEAGRRRARMQAWTSNGLRVTRRRCPSRTPASTWCYPCSGSCSRPATGSPRRRWSECCAPAAGWLLDRAQRIGQPVSLIMSDLDHSKAINDRHGHLGGDEVLRVTGAQLARHARTGDIHCRYGGEEFLLVLPNAAHHVALARAEQLRRSLAAEPVTFGAARIAVTASFGVATSPRHGTTGDKLIGATDSAMYAAKSAGRNCVKAASQTVPTPAA